MARKFDNALFAESLKEIRVHQVRITQEELANRSGIDKNSIARYETGGTTPGFDMVVALSTALGVTPNDLYPAFTAD